MIEALNVLDHMRKRQARGVQLAVRQRIEHEGVIWVWTVADADFFWVHEMGSPK
jgi:hypothetical protein